MDDKIIHTFKYGDENISLLPDGRFAIGKEDDGLQRIYDSLAQARAALDRRWQTRARTKKEKLNIPVYVRIEHRNSWGRGTGDEFVERTLVGVHAGLGTLLLNPPVSKDDKTTVYVRNERVTDLLVKEAELEKSLECVRKVLASFTLSDTYSYHSRIDETRHAEIVREIKEKCGVGNPTSQA